MRTIITTMGLLALALPAQSLQVVPVPPRAQFELHHAMAAFERGLPAMERGLAALERSMPQLDRAMIALDRSMPALERNMPDLERSMMSLERSMPALERGLAGMEHSMPMLEAYGHMLVDAQQSYSALPPEAWVQEDPADSLWRAGRAALTNGNAPAAINAYNRIRTEARYARSEYRDDAYLWEARARQTVGTRTELEQARTVLQQLRRTYPRYENMSEVAGLESRIDAALAEMGNASAAERVARGNERLANTQCPDHEIQMAAVEAMISMPATETLPILKRVMARRDDCSTPLREQAVFLIARTKSPETAALMLQVAKTDPSPKVRQQAVFWLSRVDGDAAVEAIEEILRTNTTDKQMLEQAVHALSQHKSARAAQLLRSIATRNDTPKGARMAAIHWLGQRNDPETSKLLREIYSSATENDAKERLLHAISRQKDPANQDFLLSVAMSDREPMSIRTTALHWAGQQDEMPIAKLSELYDKAGTREMKEQIIYTISRRQETEALDKLMSIARTEKDTNLRKTAIFWIGKSKDPRAQRFLADLIGG